MELATLALVASATALATGLGAVPVFLLGTRAEQLRPFLWGIAVGLMGVASVVGLLLPALDEGGSASVGAGLATGVVFLLGSRRLLQGRDVHVGELRGAGVTRSLLVFGVLLVHSLPEGFAIGTAFASNTQGLALFVILAIGLQNVPEGTSVAIPMDGAGFTRAQQFWAAVLTSAPQPRRRGLPGRRAGQRAASLFVRLRSGSDALARHGRTLTPGLRARRANCGRGRRRDGGGNDGGTRRDPRRRVRRCLGEAVGRRGALRGSGWRASGRTYVAHPDDAAGKHGFPGASRVFCSFSCCSTN